MPVECVWFDEQERIIQLCYVEAWTLDEYVAAELRMEKMLRGIAERFDIISDLTKASFTLPIGSLGGWLDVASARHEAHPNWGFTVGVANSSVVDAYGEAARELSDVIRQHVRWTKTIEEAAQLIMGDRKKYGESQQ